MMKTHHRRCNACGMKYELFEHQRFNGHTGKYDPPTLHARTRGVEDDFLDCPRCGSAEWHDVVGTPNLLVRNERDDAAPYLMRAPDVHERSLSQSHFPYYDSGLNMMLQSPEHREWAKSHYADGTRREEPLVWVGDELPFEPIAMVDKQIAKREEVNAKWNAYKDEMLAHPDTRAAWHAVEAMTEARDFSPLGVDDPEFFGPTHYPPPDEPLKQDLDGYLYTDSGWSSDHPQPWVPMALEAAGHQPLLPEPTPLQLEAAP